MEVYLVVVVAVLVLVVVVTVEVVIVVIVVVVNMDSFSFRAHFRSLLGSLWGSKKRGGKKRRAKARPVAENGDEREPGLSP
jgi:hypothetical protein